jgi:hypothetical protein
MLHEFVAANRDALIEMCRAKVALRRARRSSDAKLAHGIPVFLEQLVRTLEMEQTAHPARSREVSGPAGGHDSRTSEIGRAASRHGRDLLRHGFTVDQVVHDYGDLCQAIAELAIERNEKIAVDEYRTLNRCLDNAIADAVTEYSCHHDALVEYRGAQALNERLGFLAHELRDLVHSATLAAKAMKSGNVGIAGATGAVLDRSLAGLRSLIDRSLADVRVSAGMPARRALVGMAELAAMAAAVASLDAQARGCRFTAEAVDPGLAVLADRELLTSAICNLLQNALKFTQPRSEIMLRARGEGDRVLIEVEDRCGGLPAGDAQRMFQAFEQGASDRSGLGLGLSITRSSVEANGGVLSVRNLPGLGCVFTIDLPRAEQPLQVGRLPESCIAPASSAD